MNCSLIMRISLAVAFLCCMHSNAMNWLRPYDILVRPELHWNEPWMLTAWTETGIGHATGFNSRDKEVNIANIWQCNQDALAMLNGFAPNSPITQKSIQVNAVDDGTRGHFNVRAQLHEVFSSIFASYYKFHDHFWFAAYLPFMEERLTGVDWIDLTKSLTAADARVKNYLTNNFCQQVSLLDPSFRPCNNWRRVGLGDVVLMIEFLKQYPQRREMLKNVMLNWCCGFNCPTGLHAGQNNILAFPFGYDGSWGVIFGGGLRVTLGRTFRAGADIRLTHLVGNSDCRRIKVAPEQTELLFLAKAPAFKDNGLFQLFSLYGQIHNILGGFSLLAGYQFYKQGLNNLQLKQNATDPASYQFSTNIANSAVSLREWMVHQIVVNASYDFGFCRPEMAAKPQLSLFFRLPFDGRRSVAFTTVGAMLAVEF